MAVHLIAFVSALVGTGAIVWWKGQREEKVAFAALAAAFVVSPLLEQRSAWTDYQFPDFLIDVTLLAALCWVAVRSKRASLAVLASLEAVYVLLYLPFWVSPTHYYRGFYYGGVVLGYLQELALVASALIAGHRPLITMSRATRQSGSSA